MRARILTGLAFALALACGRIELGSYGMGGMTSNTDDDQAEQDNGQRPPDVIIIGPVTSETTLEPANPETTRPGEDESIVPSDEHFEEMLELVRSAGRGCRWRRRRRGLTRSAVRRRLLGQDAHALHAAFDQELPGFITRRTGCGDRLR